MCIFYLLHEITGFNEDIPDGKRNARIFIIGIILYCLLYIFLINLWDKNVFSQNTADAIFWCGLILFISDISLISYIYKSYYGRSIINEIKDEQDEWLFDKENHKYYKIDKIKVYKDDTTKTNSENNILNLEIKPKKSKSIKIIDENNKTENNKTENK